MEDDAFLRLTWWKSVGLFALRLHAGLSISAAGYDKIPVTWFGDQVAGLGFPEPLLFAWVAAIAQFIGGVLLTIGLYTRVSSLFLSVTMGVAAFLFHKATPLIECQIAQLYFFVFLMFVFVGPGDWSIDRWLALGREAGARWRGLVPILILIALGAAVVVKTNAAQSADAQDQTINADALPEPNASASPDSPASTDNPLD